MLRAAAVAALAVGGLTAVAAPAYADDTVGVSVLGLNDFNPGDSQTLQIQVQLKQAISGGGGETIRVAVSGLGGNFTVTNPQNCTPTGSSSCAVTFNNGNPGSQQISFTVRASNNPNVAPGQTATSTGTVNAQDFNGHNDSQTFRAVLHGPPQQTPTAVAKVTGKVTDSSTGKGIANATVELQDPDGHTFRTGTGSSGTYTFQSTQAKPITPGTLSVGATKDGYQDGGGNSNTRTFDAAAGATANAPPIALIPVAATASPVDGLPTGDPNASLAVPGDTAAAAANTNTGSGIGGFSMILIGVGGLLVLLGILAIVLILRGRKRDDGDGLDDDIPPMRRGPMPTPASRGAYRGAPNNAPTMVSRSPMMDAPTAMMRGGPMDEYGVPADPYGAPPISPPPAPRSPQPTSGGYGPTSYQTPGYPPERPYDDYGAGGGHRAGYGEPTQRGGYGGESGGFAPPAHRQPADPYAEQQATRGYGGGNGGYGPEQSYGDQNYGGGYGDQGYEPQGYEPTRRAPRDEYDPRAAGRPEEATGRFGRPPAGPAQRRQLDW
ncbi:MAG: carboxypeptidase regulatory-like domain-containing protein, partial [Micromonosporaceae bacterium]|nr:carboxypeptidase regulatory-like domain-containing protein [Micromonosporaceae bacterium]